MDIVQKCRQEYLVAKERLLAKTEVGGTQLCARGRVYRAMSMAPQFEGEKRPAFLATFNKLEGEANALIVAYNEAGFAYASLSDFAAQGYSIEAPDCDCEWCQKVKDQPVARGYHAN